MTTPFTSRKIECRLCHDVIFSRYSGEFVTCKCGSISIDSTEHYTRYIGEPENIILKDEAT